MSAAQGGRPCSVCARADRLLIECEVIETGLSATAAKYKIPKSSLSRHQSNHVRIDTGFALAEPPPIAAEPPPAPPALIHLQAPATPPAPSTHRRLSRWQDTDPPSPGARCQRCGGASWWSASSGWSCSRCHPSHHLQSHQKREICT